MLILEAMVSINNMENMERGTEKYTPSIKKNYILSSLYQILLFIVPLISAPYISRVIGVEGVGISSYTRSLQSYFLLFASLGTASYGAREIARKRENKHDYTKSFIEIEILSVISSLVCLFAWLIFANFYTEYKEYLFALTIGVIAVIFDISWFYAGLEQFKYTVIQNTFFKIVNIILLFSLIKSSDDLLLYLIITNCATLVANISMWVYLPKFLVVIKGERLDILVHFKETLVYFIPTIAASIYTVLDKTLIGVLINETYTEEKKEIINGVETTVTVIKHYSDLENGYYEEATKVIDMAKALTFTSLNSVMGSRISYLFKKKDFLQIKEKINQSLDYILFMGLGCTLGIVGVAKQFVPLFFGNNYLKVIPYLILLSPIIIIIGISNCLGTQYYTPGGYRKKSAIFIIIGALVNLILNCILIPFFWGYGAIIASLVSEMIILILYMANCNKIITIKEILIKSWKKLISGSIMTIFCLAVGFFLDNGIATLIMQVVFGFLIYCFVLFLLKDSFVELVLKKIRIRKKERKNK